MVKLNTFENIFQQIDDTTITVTPNRRLAATLHKYYDQWQIAQEKQTWKTPTILPLVSWFDSLWRHYVSDNISHKSSNKPLPLLLNSTQTEFVWKELVRHYDKCNHLLRPSDTTHLLQSASDLLTAWNLNVDHPLFSTSEESIALQHLVLQYREACANHHWLDASLLPNHLLNIHFSLPNKIILLGFNDISPQIQTFLNHCQSRGTLIIRIDYLSTYNANNTRNVTRISLNEREDEHYCAARYAYSIYQQGLHETTIGLVIPDLDKVRDRVAQIFSEIFHGDNQAYNISAGLALAKYPIIQTVFEILSLKDKKISNATLWHLLSSPFVGDAESEIFARAHFDLICRDKNISHLNLDNQYEISLLTQYCPKLAKRIISVLAYLQDASLTRSPSNWAHYINQMLTLMGWPGERSLNSEEYQTVDAWLKLLHEFMLLDQVISTIHFGEARQALLHMANHHVFQPKTPDAAIQILGILEAAALPFDYLWIAGMEDTAWPPQPKPNPFIPRQLQREHQMPHATAERELAYCEQLIQQFKQSADTVVFSHAQKKDDLAVEMSPLIQTIPENTYFLNELGADSFLSLNTIIMQTSEIEWMEDSMAPPITDDERKRVRGGANILTYQSLCPFRAFSECRLQTKELSEHKSGLRAKERGTLIHKSLEFIWSALKDHASLMALDESSEKQLVDESIAKSFTILNLNHHYHQRYLTLEKKRLSKLLTQWLALEKKRDPFTVIATEIKKDILIDQLPINIKIDRIDTLENGLQLIIDYKTGKNNTISAWFGERPIECQLPLYAQIDSGKTAGISYGQVIAGNCQFKGVARESACQIEGIYDFSQLKQPTSNWENQMQAWRNTFEKLIKDFSAGCAEVDPKEGEKTCQYCSLKSLCRLLEEMQNDVIHVI